MAGKLILYDTTLRDGAQKEGISFSVVDKLEIARKLDVLGIGYIEGGWPGSNPKDAEFFKKPGVSNSNRRKSRFLVRPAAPGCDAKTIPI